MRKIVGQSVVVATLAAVALLPLAGTASAAPSEPTAQSSSADRCWGHHGRLFCDWDHRDRDRDRDRYDRDGLLDLDLGLGLL